MFIPPQYVKYVFDERYKAFVSSVLQTCAHEPPIKQHMSIPPPNVKYIFDERYKGFILSHHSYRPALMSHWSLSQWILVESLISRFVLYVFIICIVQIINILYSVLYDIVYCMI